MAVYSFEKLGTFRGLRKMSKDSKNMCSNFFFLMFWKTLVATEEMETRFSYKIY